MQASFLVTMVFVAATLLGAGLFLRAVPRAQVGVVRGLIAAWALMQLAIAATGFYTVTHTLPPRFALAIAPPLLVLLSLAAIPGGRAWLGRLDLRALTLMHVMRVSVEWGLHQLYVEGYVPQVMTWEGRNLDVLTGLTAPVVAWLAFRGAHVRRGLLLAWNVGGLVLLTVIVFHGILSVPTPLQQFGFEQPNVALMYPPFIWVPAVVVPLALVGHIAVLTRR